jgi:hypothetical protein
MLPTIISRSNEMNLGETLASLTGHESVDGVLIIGSAATDQLSLASDYDLLLVLADMPMPLHVALTYIDRRLTDIVFTSISVITRLVTGDTRRLSYNSLEGKVIYWLQTGRIAFDREGRLDQAQKKAQTIQFEMADAGEIYSSWFSINYNVKQTKRMLASTDSAYLMMVDLRLLFSLHDLWLYYFRLRNLHFPGKEAIRYLTAHDPDYLELFQRCLAETHREQKVQLYEQLARQTIAPVGGLWEEGRTAVQFELGTDWRPGLAEEALAFWESLVTG